MNAKKVVAALVAILLLLVVVEAVQVFMVREQIVRELPMHMSRGVNQGWSEESLIGNVADMVSEFTGEEQSEALEITLDGYEEVILYRVEEKTPIHMTVRYTHPASLGPIRIPISMAVGGYIEVKP